MKPPAALLNDPVYKRAAKLCATISEHRFALAALAYVRCQAAGIRHDWFVVELTREGLEVKL